MVNGRTPRVHASAFVAAGAVVLGDVELGPEASVWYGCVLRGDMNWIHVGARSNIQDLSLLHVHYKGDGTWVGDEVVVGHRVVLHSCRLEDRVLVGNGAVVLDRAVVETGAVVAAGSVVAPGARIPAGTLAMGQPARVRRDLKPEELLRTRAIVDRYVRVSRLHADRGLTLDFSGDPL